MRVRACDLPSSLEAAAGWSGRSGQSDLSQSASRTRPQSWIEVTSSTNQRPVSGHVTNQRPVLPGQRAHHHPSVVDQDVDLGHRLLQPLHSGPGENIDQ